MTAAKRLASFVAGLDLAKVPGPVAATATLLALDTLGSCLAAASRTSGGRSASVAERLGGPRRRAR